MRALARDASGQLSAAAVGSTNLVVTYPDELVNDALAKMLRNNIGRLPVVERRNLQHLVGYLGRGTILTARLLRVEEEEVRETGWLHTYVAR